VSSEQLHLTLAFMAAVEQARVPPLVAAISRGFDDPPFTIAFSGFGVFPPHGRPRVLFLEVVEGAAKLAAVQRLVAERLAEQGIALEDRPYRPHLTLARWREGHSADARRILASARGERLQQDVAHVTLYHSRLSSNGATHTALAKGELAGAQ
jgi:2'-5' RNA ligase